MRADGPIPPPLFPYMTWAQTESFRSPWSLSQSGMPMPDAELLGGPLDPAECLPWPGMGARQALEERIASWHGVDPARVLAVPGASAGMHLVADCLFRGARVLHETPRYEPLEALPRLFAAEPMPLARRIEHGWTLDPEEAAEAARGARGAVHLFLTNPHNPTGAVLERSALAALGEVAAGHGGVVASCEVYADFNPHPEARLHCANLLPNGITIGSMTKAWGLGPLRVGWVVLGEGLAHLRPLLVDRAHLSWVDPPTASLVLAARALERAQDLLQPVRRVEVECRPLLDRWLRETPGVRALVPPMGIYAFPLLDGISDTRSFATWLADTHGVDVVAGEHFGAPGGIRVGCGVPVETLREGLARLTRALAEAPQRAPSGA
ncbi:MAG: pyridoxal phosphate-dependent aminotransferase [Planctomycetes bacterium]|nr:pyridoxal phosphate-dependent aminotransferase [Planctomycetota bacterium]MDA0948073.1 pyridoxal phosphate-dependent aminotransferase [Planctomycetota bacterium]